MKYLLLVLLLVAVLITAGCTSGNQNTVVTPPQTTSPLPINTLTTTASTTAPTIAVSTPTQTYKTADLVLVLNTNPTYEFKIDYPSEWTYNKKPSKLWRSGYNFSSPDEKSYVSVYIDNEAGTVYYYPLITRTENSALEMTDKGSWAGNIIKAMTEPSYCIDGSGIQISCPGSASGKEYYHRRLISNETVTLSGNVKAYKMVFAPDIRDRQESSEWNTVYIMYVGKMQGYNFTVPQHREVAVKVDGPVWDYAMGGMAYTINQNTPKDQVNVTSEIFDHMAKSFEVTIKQ